MTSPNYRLSPAASKQRHHDSAGAILVTGIAIGIIISCIIIALAMALHEIAG